MPKPFKVEGVDYSPEGIEVLRQELVGWRDEMMKQNAFHEVMAISHVIVLLAYLIELQAYLIELQTQE